MSENTDRLRAIAAGLSRRVEVRLHDMCHRADAEYHPAPGDALRRQAVSELAELGLAVLGPQGGWRATGLGRQVAAQIRLDEQERDTKSSNRPPRVIGLDLSIAAPGIAHADGTLETAAPWAAGDHRLPLIRQSVALAVRDWGCDLAVIEDLPTHARSAGLLGMVHGVVRHLLLGEGVPYALVPPASVKKYATNRGNATKADMRMALFQRTGLDNRDDNQVDAAWLRHMGLDHLGVPEVVLPGTHRAALRKVTWPEVGER